MIQFRLMEEEDVEAVSKIEEETFSMPWRPEDFLDMIRKDNSYYVVAEEVKQTDSEVQKKIIASGGVMNILGEGDITNIAVKASERGKGIGTALLTFLMEEGKKFGITAYTLEVRVSNQTAIHVYEKLGFVSEGIRRGFYDCPKEDAVIMWKR